MSKRKIEDPETTSTSRKLRRNQESDEPSLEGMGKFQELPQEMFEKIVNYLPCKEKLNMALTSKAMDQAIGTNLSIMKDIVLKITKSLVSSGGLILGNRRYVNIAFEGRIVTSEIPIVKKALKKMSTSIAYVNLGYSMCPSAATDLIKMFKNIQEVKNLQGRGRFIPGFRKFRNVLDTSEIMSMSLPRELIDSSNAAVAERIKNDVQTPLNLPKLKYLGCSMTTSIQLFKNCKLESLSIIDFPGNMYHFTKLKNLLTEQNNLKSLKLSGFKLYEEGLLMDAELPFKLNKLELSSRSSTYIDKNAVVKDNYQKFINLHRETLTHLVLIESEDLKYFHDFRFLKNVKITMYGTRSTALNQLMPFVEKLSLAVYLHTTSHNYMRVIDNFPNLKEFEFRGYNLSANQPLTHNNIEKLHLQSCSFPSITMPNLKNLKLVKKTFPANQNPFEESYINIQEMRLEGCVNSDYWLTIFIEHADIKLNLLELRDMNITTNCFTVIERNSHKIRDIIISNVTFT